MHAGQVLGEGEHLVAVLCLLGVPLVGDCPSSAIPSSAASAALAARLLRRLRGRAFVAVRPGSIGGGAWTCASGMRRISAMPSPRRSAVSIESVSRRSMPSRRTSGRRPPRWCAARSGPARARPVGELYELAVHPRPGEALLGEVVEERRVLALAPADDRREDLKRVPSGRSPSRSTICWGLWRVTRRPQLGQCGWPIRAKSRRR